MAIVAQAGGVLQEATLIAFLTVGWQLNERSPDQPDAIVPLCALGHVVFHLPLQLSFMDRLASSPDKAELRDAQSSVLPAWRSRSRTTRHPPLRCRNSALARPARCL